MKLISNGIGYQLTAKEAVLWYSELEHPIAKRGAKEKKGVLINEAAIDGELQFSTDSDVFFYSFIKLEGLDRCVRIKLEHPILKKEFVKWRLYDQLKHTDFLIDLSNIGSDLSIYQRNLKSSFSDWDSYTSYDINIKKSEVYISIGSKNTLIHKAPISGFLLDGIELFKGVKNGLILHKKKLDEEPVSCLASREVRIAKGLNTSPERPKFSTYYSNISSLYRSLVELSFEGLIFFKNGFRKLEEGRDYFQVARTYNVMVFGGGYSNVNVSNGLKKYGPYLIPEDKFVNLEFVFIYSSKEKVTELHNDLRYGKGYFSGLERFVKVPFRVPDKSAVLKYEQKEIDNLPNLVDNKFKQLKESFPNKIFFALVLIPESRKDIEKGDALGEHHHYFELKKVLLKHGVSSQFIDEREIGRNEFVYWLPNIAVAILAKLGGIPWRLNRSVERELIIGFGVKRRQDTTYLGSTVFFDNSGKLKSSGYFASKDADDFISVLKRSILNFIKSEGVFPERLVIHYYKIPGSSEIDAIDSALREMEFNVPYVIVTINDTKSKAYIAFDESYGFGMPISGIAWRVSRDEYILFNNSRYEVNPTQGKPPADEYPIKLKIYFSNSQNISEASVRQVIGQIFEFSRIYWKSIRQQSKPVTATYSEMIAEFGSHFEIDEIYQNDFPWFI